MHLFELIESRGSAWVHYDGFECLYVRVGKRFFGSGEHFVHCIDLANLKARRPGQGAFRALIRELRARCPNTFIYVEQVMSHRFEAGLLRMGFEADEIYDRCYWLVPECFQLGEITADAI